jgi:hypothetical protein
MTWILDRGGTILYKAEWTSAARVADYLERRAEQRSGRMAAAFHTEQLELRNVDRDAFYEGLHRNGPRAYTEFKRAEEIWAERART